MPGFLVPYRVLDLSDERGLLAGAMLARLGAEVVQLEPLKGSSARRVGPFDPGVTAPDNSFFWSAYAAGKQGLACDLASEEGRALVRRLLSKADFLIDSADPGVMSTLGLGVEQVRAINPALIHVSITAFGSEGPKAGYAATDLTVWAAGGPMRLTRDGDRPPMRFSVAQTFLNAAADAANAALIAHFARVQSGLGQHVDVSAQQSATLCTLAASLSAAYRHEGFTLGAASGVKSNKKQLDLSGSGARTRRSKWQVRDGLVEMHLGIGPGSGRFTNNLFKWMLEEGACTVEMGEWDWVKLPQRIIDDKVTDDDLEHARTCVAQFFKRFSKEEMLEKALQHRFLCAPIANTQDLLDSRQLESRNFFSTVVERSGHERKLPGKFAHGADGGFAPIRPAPSIGEHTDEILTEWLGLEGEAINQLRSQGVIA
ncbi:CoA transferase [Pseudomonas sp. OTU5201]|uniref:CoA transferase n=1 Tax=Pseudomonas sp. OTU5201 TaxID=3043850 RepID=UPI00313C8E4E